MLVLVQVLVQVLHLATLGLGLLGRTMAQEVVKVEGRRQQLRCRPSPRPAVGLASNAGVKCDTALRPACW